MDTKIRINGFFLSSSSPGSPGRVVLRRRGRRNRRSAEKIRAALARETFLAFRGGQRTRVADTVLLGFAKFLRSALATKNSILAPNTTLFRRKIPL